MARKVCRVVSAIGRWQVKHEGGVLSCHDTGPSAVVSGRGVAVANKPSRLAAHHTDDAIELE